MTKTSTQPRDRHCIRPGKGFTLLELLVAMSMAAMVAGALYSALRIGFRAEASAEAAAEPVRTAELALGLLRPDFESALPPSATASATGTAGSTGTSSAAAAAGAAETLGNSLRGRFFGTDGTGAGGQPADTLQFFTLGDPFDDPVTAQTDTISSSSDAGTGMELSSGNGTSTNNAAGGAVVPGASEVRMVDLMLVPTATGQLLVRRITTGLPGQTQSPAAPTATLMPGDEVICRGVRSFNLRYCDGSAWQDSWDSDSMDSMLPTAVEVTLELERPDRDTVQVKRFTRVFLMSCSGLWSAAATSGTTGGTGQ
jgi:prepilin-type N-terminal cleavage/methylation domain-containing protein